MTNERPAAASEVTDGAPAPIPNDDVDVANDPANEDYGPEAAEEDEDFDEADGEDDDSEEDDEEEASGSARWMLLLPACGCLLACCLLTAGLGALAWFNPFPELTRGLPLPGATATFTPGPSQTAEATAPSGVITGTAVPSLTLTVRPGVTGTVTVTGTATVTGTGGITVTATPRPTVSGTPSLTATGTVTASASPSPGPTINQTPPATGTVQIQVLQIARLTTAGTRADLGQAVFGADNRGFAGQVQFTQVPRGATGQIAVIWERLEGNSAVELRPAERISFNDSFHATSWWYALRAEAGLPAGTYQFGVALVLPNGSLERQGAVKFEVRPSR